MNTSRDCKLKGVAPFLKSLRQILVAENPAILRWTCDGKAFEIHDMALMIQHVLPKYFKHSKYTSFQRQLNYFNFRKWSKSKATVCTFSNPFFQRDQPALTWRITRKRSKSIGAITIKTTRPKPMVIELPSDEFTSSASFPSPTDTYSITDELDFRSVYGDVTLNEPRAEQSLDWVDVLFSSLSHR